MNQDFVQVPCPSCGTIVWISPGVGFAKCPSCQTTTQLPNKQNAAFAQTMPAQPSLMAEILKSDPPPKPEPRVAPPAPSPKPSSKPLALALIVGLIGVVVVALVVWLAARHAAQDVPPDVPGAHSAP